MHYTSKYLKMNAYTSDPFYHAFYNKSLVLSIGYTFLLLFFLGFVSDCSGIAFAFRWHAVATILLNVTLLVYFVVLHNEVYHPTPTMDGYKAFILVWLIIFATNIGIVCSYVSYDFAAGVWLFVFILLEMVYYLVYVTRIMLFPPVEPEQFV